MISRFTRPFIQGTPDSSETAGYEPDRDALEKVREELESKVLSEAAVPSYDHSNPLIRELFRTRGDVVMSYLSETSSHVMDLGCGTAAFSVHLTEQGYDVVAVDVHSEVAASYLRATGDERDNPSLVTGSASGLPFDSAVMDTIVAMDVLEHIADVEHAISECRRVLTDKGQLLVSGPSENAMYKLGRIFAGFSAEYHERSIYTLDEQIQDSGWERTNNESIRLGIAGIGSTMFEIYEYHPS